jgi:hypothetical protein
MSRPAGGSACGPFLYCRPKKQTAQLERDDPEILTSAGIVLCAVEKHGTILYNTAMSYKVVETSTVTDDEIERILNEWTARGYVFSSIHFVTTQASRRPGMAFLFFTGPDADEPAEAAERTEP